MRVLHFQTNTTILSKRDQEVPGVWQVTVKDWKMRILPHGRQQLGEQVVDYDFWVQILPSAPAVV